MKKFLRISMIVAAMAAAADTGAWASEQCTGQVMTNGKEYWLGDQEGICEFHMFENRVLKICPLGSKCLIAGDINLCKNSGECVEVKRVTGVKRIQTKHGPRR